MTLPQRLDTREIRAKPKLRSKAHRDWVRGHRCSVSGCFMMPIETAHVRSAATAGMGMKSSDAFCLSLCGQHHRQSHTVGEHTFQVMYDIDLKKLAREFYERSPHRKKLDSPYA